MLPDRFTICEAKIEMTPEEVIEFLKDVERGFGARDDVYPYVEKYLELLV
jgi:hypothetical protein